MDIKNSKLANLFHLSHKVTVFVPSTVNVSEAIGRSIPKKEWEKWKLKSWKFLPSFNADLAHFQKLGMGESER